MEVLKPFIGSAFRSQHALDALSQLALGYAGKPLDLLYSRLGGLNGRFFPQGWGNLGIVNLKEDIDLIKQGAWASEGIKVIPCAGIACHQACKTPDQLGGILSCSISCSSSITSSSSSYVIIPQLATQPDGYAIIFNSSSRHAANSRRYHNGSFTKARALETLEPSR
eukprot:GHRQ01021586.1.p1 GENE.GHRQ01021586.1~~GHRQ01021586.1.p1  ORF type:complete len:167 (+),score=20.66 GHRQ01021586.1:387-887(+)